MLEADDNREKRGKIQTEMPGCNHWGNNWMVPLKIETGTQDKRIHNKGPKMLK